MFRCFWGSHTGRSCAIVSSPAVDVSYELHIRVHRKCNFLGAANKPILLEVLTPADVFPPPQTHPLDFCWTPVMFTFWSTDMGGYKYPHPPPLVFVTAARLKSRKCKPIVWIRAGNPTSWSKEAQIEWQQMLQV